MSYLDDLIQILEDDNVAEWGVDLFTSTRSLPPVLAGGAPTLQLIETGGTSPENTHNATLRPAFLRPSVQVVARAGSKVDAEDMAYRAFVSLFGIRNRFIGDNWHQIFRPLQSPFDLGLDDRGQIKYGFNGLGKYNRRGDGIMAQYTLIAMLGGNENAFQTPPGDDQYPTGATFDKIVPGSVPVLLNSTTLPAGTYVLEASARISAAGARVKLALVNFATPDTAIVEITFTADEVIGERKRSAAFSVPASDTIFAVKITSNHAAIAGAAWGIRILRT